MTPTPRPAMAVQESTAGPVWHAKWRHVRLDGTHAQVRRRVGLAWLERDEAGEWTPRKGRPKGDFLDRRAAELRAAEVVAEEELRLAEQDRLEREQAEAPTTFREVATAWLAQLEATGRAKPATLRDYRAMLAEPGTPLAKGWATDANGKPVTDANGDPVRAKRPGLILNHLGDLPAAEVTTADVERLLEAHEATGAGARAVNRTRQLVATVYAYGCKRSTYALPENPAAEAVKRREKPVRAPGAYSVAEVHKLADALEAGEHRPETGVVWKDSEIIERRREDRQDACAVLVAAFTGLRRGELVALRWGDLDLDGRTLHVRRAVSAGKLVDGPKSGKTRVVPLADQAVEALRRLQDRPHFTSADDYVLVGRAGDRLNADTLGKRVVAAMDPAGIPKLGFHALRHSAATLLAHGGLDPVSVQSVLGHAKLSTTGRYFQQVSAARQAPRLTEAFRATQRAV